jgi:hypothetical protein
MWRYHPQHQMAKQAIAQSVIGEIRIIRAAFTYTANSGGDNIRFNRELGEEEPKVVTATARFSKEFEVAPGDGLMFPKILQASSVVC